LFDNTDIIDIDSTVDYRLQRLENKHKRHFGKNYLSNIQLKNQQVKKSLNNDDLATTPDLIKNAS